MTSMLVLVHLAVAGTLLLSVVVGLVRVWRGPRAEDRMLAAQLFGTTGVSILLLLAEPMAERALRDVALVLAVLAVLAVVAFVGRVGASPTPADDARSADVVE
jgi:multicomponent Na+:H+ antiporter subunit F